MGVWCSVTIDYKLDRSKHFSIRKAIEEFLAGHDYSLRVEDRQTVKLSAMMDGLLQK